MPLLVNVVEGGKTPELELQEYVDLGFGVVLFANYLMRSMMLAGREALAHLAAHGETGSRADRMASWTERQALVHLPEFTAAEAALDQPWSGVDDRRTPLRHRAARAGRRARARLRPGRLRGPARRGRGRPVRGDAGEDSEIGGSTVKSAGLSAFAGTEEQRAQGIADSVELLRKDLLEVGRHRNDERLVDLYCEHQLDTYTG